MKKKILVVDDELTSCYLLKNFLSKDYDVIARFSGLEALNWLNNNLPDLIISDITNVKYGWFWFFKTSENHGVYKTHPCNYAFWKVGK